MKVLIVLLLLPGPAFAQPCIPDPAKLTFGEKVSDEWVARCEQQFRNPMPTCHKLYSLPSDRELCLRAIEKIDEYHKQKPTHKTRNDFPELKQ